jgi:hypothetical protein
MGAYSRTYALTNGTVAYGDQVIFELDALGSSVNNIVNAQISSGAAITDAKLATISSAGKVSGAAITLLTSIPSEAGALPPENFVENFSEQLLHVRDEKTAGTSGGTFTTGAWRTRDLNTEITNEITGASLASNQITLPAGTYFIQARVPTQATNNTVSKLRNITAGSDVIIGSSGLAMWNAAVEWNSWIVGRFTIAGETVFEIQHNCSYTGTFGTASNLGVTEVYTEVQIWKVA